MPRATFTRSTDARGSVAGDALRDRPVSIYSFTLFFLPFFLFVSFFFLDTAVRNRGVSLDTHIYTLGEIGTRLFGHASCRNVYMIIGYVSKSPIREDRHELRIRIGARLSYYKNYAYICACPRATLASRLACTHAEYRETELQRASGFLVANSTLVLIVISTR